MEKARSRAGCRPRRLAELRTTLCTPKKSRSSGASRPLGWQTSRFRLSSDKCRQYLRELVVAPPELAPFFVTSTGIPVCSSTVCITFWVST